MYLESMTRQGRSEAPDEYKEARFSFHLPDIPFLPLPIISLPSKVPVDLSVSVSIASTNVDSSAAAAPGPLPKQFACPPFMVPHSNLIRIANILILRAAYFLQKSRNTIIIYPLPKFTALKDFRLPQSTNVFIVVLALGQNTYSSLDAHLAVHDEPGKSHCISTGRCFTVSL
ncbi:hypothetical protein ARMSODRAFT_445658 [Armillaria solidipes]|uniref:Uncharacterized protein n=1 Tax=Armillaria solidipes TaxID=1076256 RepID=A0A2H3B8G4_9AGAR|nr:hypothetical protein ARMSODRAFT_445658 [Armillaria solidipes]